MLNKKDNNENIIWESCITKINCKEKNIWAKDLLSEINCKQPLISNTVYGRWHSKLFTNCHVSWDTLYYVSTFVGHPVLTLNRRRVRRIERKDDFYSGLFTEIKIVLGITIYLKKILKGGHVQIPQSKITYI